MTTNFFIGSMINNYEILEQIGHGGMGDVYLARHPQIGKKVAIKLLRPETPKTSETAQRFFHEAMVVDKIHHQNVIDVLDFGKTPEGDCYIIMEYLQGEPLSSLIEGDGPLSLGVIGHIGLQLCSALAAAHSNGVIHRDLKSENIFLIERDAENFVKIFDFGIAKLLGDVSPSMTLAGTTMGTPIYMSPEQAMGLPINGQTDIYALGVLLYYMATKTYPFFDRNPIVVANMQALAPLPLPSTRLPGISPALEAVIVRCLEKEQRKRYYSMEEVATALALACDLNVTDYFGKKRGHTSAQPVVSVLAALPESFLQEPMLSEDFVAQEVSLRLLSSEIIPKAQSTKRHVSLSIAVLLLVVASFFVVSTRQTLDTSPGAEIPTLRALSKAPTLFQIPTSLLSQPKAVVPEKSPSNIEKPVVKQKPEVAPTAEKPAGAFKKLRGLFTKKNITYKK
jgi:serine/threonine protein kinase